MARYQIDPARSRVWIEARSNVHPIHTEADGLSGWLDLEVDDGKINVDATPRGHLEFPVENLTSGKGLEDRELRRRIDARKFPTISGDLKSMKDDTSAGVLLVSGDLTFRGVTKSYEDEMKYENLDDGTVKLTGRSTFDIRDFGMEPPRILMLKVQPDVTVRVEVVAGKGS